MQVASNLLHILHFINTWCRAVLSSTDDKLVAAEVTRAYGTETKNKLIFKKINIAVQTQKSNIPKVRKILTEYKPFLFPVLQEQLKNAAIWGLYVSHEKLHENLRLNQTTSPSFKKKKR